MTQNLENATKATQCAALLCDDLKSLEASTDSLILADVVKAEFAAAFGQLARLERLARTIGKMESAT